jgi:hypothetical protein
MNYTETLHMVDTIKALKPLGIESEQWRRLLRISISEAD